MKVHFPGLCMHSRFRGAIRRYGGTICGISSSAAVLCGPSPLLRSMSLSLLLAPRRYTGVARESDSLCSVFVSTLRVAIALTFAVVSSLARAQSASAAAVDSSAHDVRPSSQLAVSLGQLFPVVRPLGQPPAVPEVGWLTTVAGARTSILITPATALIDVRMYRAQLSSIFPIGASYYPADSLRQLGVARARQWVDRLRAGKTPIDGRALVTFAQLAMEAGQDTLAKRLFDVRLAELTKGKKLISGERTVPIERSLTLDAAIQTLADPTLDSARIVANLPGLRTYAMQLAAIPTTGYGNKSDSAVVLYRQFDVAVALLLASDAAHIAKDVLVQSEHILSLIPQFGLGERFSLLGQRYPYREVATTLVAQPNGRARLDSLNARILVLGVPRDAEFPTDMSEDRREMIRRQSRSAIEARIASFALIGREAPAISAHAWLNTPDSLYAPTPRTRRWNDGTIHVLVFGDQEQDNLAILERVQRHFAAGVQVIFVTSTEGNIGPDIMAPGDEVAWLRGFYHDIRHVTIPIALWAGAKVPGPLNTSTPMRSMVYRDYYVQFLGGLCVLISGDGVVRGYEPLRTREDEIRLIDRIERLRASQATRTSDDASSAAGFTTVRADSLVVSSSAPSSASALTY